MLTSPLCEELILRAYTITETEALTGSSVVAVFISVFVQILGHLYQGAVPAALVGAVFLIFSWYYVRCRRITPPLLAHYCMNLLSMALLRLHA